MKVGIVGTGFMGATHAEGWAATDAEIVGFVADNVSSAEALARQYNARAFPDLDALLPAVDVVDICTPTHLHAGMVVQAAAAGKHVVCEKPLALTVADAGRMIRACQEAGVQLLVAHVVRYFPQYALAKETVAAGRIGRPGVIRLTRGSYRPKKPVGNWFLDERKSGGILMDLMIHDFDYARWLAGDVHTVYAKKVTGVDAGAPVDYGLAILRHQSGAISHVAGAWAYPPPTFRTALEVAGDAGLLHFDSEATAPIVPLLHKAAADAPDVALPGSPTDESPYTTQIKDFYRALRDGAPARVTPADGLAAVQIAVAAILSAQRGEAVSIEEVAALHEQEGNR